MRRGLVGAILVAVAAGGPAQASALDTWDRGAVKDAYAAAVVDGRRVSPGGTGSADTCTAGTESPASQAAGLAAVNFARAMNGLPPVSLDASLSNRALSAAMMMTANNSLSHSPPSTWRCWTQEGSTAAGTSNLGLGYRTSTATVIDGYIGDPGDGNRAAGHRRWILLPTLGTIGIGTTSNANALTVIGTGRQSRVAAETVSWPPSGYVPWPLVYGRFSLSSSKYPGADYSNAQVTVTANGTPLGVTVNPVANGYGDNTVVADVATPAALRNAQADTTFVMTVSNVSVSGSPVPLTLSSRTIAFDPGAAIVNTGGGSASAGTDTGKNPLTPSGPSGATASAGSASTWTSTSATAQCPTRPRFNSVIYADGVTSFYYRPQSGQTIRGARRSGAALRGMLGSPSGRSRLPRVEYATAVAVNEKRLPWFARKIGPRRVMTAIMSDASSGAYTGIRLPYRPASGTYAKLILPNGTVHSMATGCAGVTSYGTIYAQNIMVGRTSG